MPVIKEIVLLFSGGVYVELVQSPAVYGRLPCERSSHLSYGRAGSEQRI